MRRSLIEPGLLRLFRLSVGIRMGIFWLMLCLWLVAPDERFQRFPFPGILETILLMGYLSWTWLRQQLGKIYLPLALIVASVGPIVEYKATVVVRMIGGMPRGMLTEDVWVLFVVLFVPLILVSWQYNFITVVGFSVATAVLDALLSILLARFGGPGPGNTLPLILIRSLFFVVVGYIVARLMKAQRVQHKVLTEANTQLTRYATTLEQLAISRERNRLSHELHDTLAHSLSAVAVQLEAVHALWNSDPEAARTMLEQSLIAVREGLHESRRAIHALRASPLEDLGFVLAIRNLAESAAERANLNLTLRTPDRISGLRPEVEQGVYRIVDEALANVARHALAENLVVQVKQIGDVLELTIEDDGQGFDQSITPMHGRFGLRGLYERANLVRGRLDIKSRPGGGTLVRFTVNGKEQI